MTETRTKSMRVRVTPEERAAIDSRAADAGFENASEFVRALALGSGTEPAADSAGTPAPAASPAHGELSARYQARFNELRKSYPLVVARRIANREVYGGAA